MNIARVFPRKTNATPDDSFSFIGYPEEDLPEVDEVHISVTFTEDLKLVEANASFLHELIESQAS